MKKIGILVLSIVVLLSCDDNEINDQSVLGKWNLTKIINTSFGGESAPEINDTHFYQLNRDGSFKRISIKDGTSDELKGTYSIADESMYYGNENNAIQKFISLSYPSKVSFFNCGIIVENKQLLILTTENKLQNTLSGACDGENYEYTKEN